MISTKPWLCDVIALSAILLATFSPSIWSRLYHQTNTAAFLLAVVMALLGIYTLVIWLARYFLKSVDTDAILRSSVVGCAALYVGVMVTGGVLGGSPVSALVAVALVISTASYPLFSRKLIPCWPRVRMAVTVGGLLFFCSAPLVGHLASRNINLFQPVSEVERIPTIWLLLDETSYGAAEQLIIPLQRLGFWTSTHALDPAGKNTLDVVPSFLLREVMGPTTAPCGITTVCASIRAVDFSRIAMGRSGIDVVGIHHPYCSMLGWRTCMDGRQQMAAWSEQWHAIVCSILRHLGNSTEACELRKTMSELEWRERLKATVLSAPFWSEGGDLYAHLLLPHMPASANPLPSLAAAYEINLRSAAEFIGVLGHRLHKQFPQGFRFVIFSDHPLRPIKLCRAAYGGNCTIPTRYAEPYQVPLIVSSLSEINFVPPTSNLNVLDFLPTKSKSSR